MRNGGDAVRICQVSEKGYFCGGIERFVFDASAALRAAGCTEGDTVSMYDLEFDFVD